MRKLLLGIAIGIIVTAPVVGQELSDAEIRTLLIRKSIAAYSGACPCPYNTMKNGRRCGGNSAYSKPGGASPLCYDTDVTDAMIERYRKAKM